MWRFFELQGAQMMSRCRTICDHPELREEQPGAAGWSVQELEWAREQSLLASRVVASDSAPFLARPDGWAANLTLVGGLDISFFPPPAAWPGAAAAEGEAPSAAASPSFLAAPPAAEERSAFPAASAALDPAPTSSSSDRAVAALAVLSFPSLEPVHTELLELPALGMPYRPGFLGFREVPAYLELLSRAAARGVHPQLLLVDGLGVLHPRRCGSASHLGVLSGLPTVGVAKSLLHLDGLPSERQVRAAAAAAMEQAGSAGSVERAEAAAAAAAAAAAVSTGSPVGEAGQSAARAGSSLRMQALPGGGSWLPLVTSSSEQVGAALCCSAPGSSSGAAVGSSTQDGSTHIRSGRGADSGSGSGGAAFPPARRPIFVSAGHRVSLATALRIVQRCCRHRVPEPIRQADLLSRAEVRRLVQQQQARHVAATAAPAAPA